MSLSEHQFDLQTARQRYGFAVLACAVAALLTAAILGVVHVLHAIAALLAAILLTGWYAGAGPAVLALGLCMALDRVLPAVLHAPIELSPGVRDVWFILFAVAAARFGTARRSMLEALRASNEHLEHEVASRTASLRLKERYLEEAERLSHTGCWVMGLNPWRPLFWSESAYRILGFDPTRDMPDRELFLGRLHPDERAQAARMRETAVRERRGWDVEHRLLLDSGEIRHIRSVGHPYYDENAQMSEYIGVVVDVTERWRMEQALRRARERNMQARFATRLAERNRIAREMHDTLLQGFTGVALELVAACERLEAASGEPHPLRNVIGLAQRTLQDARNAIWGLRTPPGSANLPGALRAAAEELAHPAHMDVRIDTSGAAHALAPALDAVVLRVAREAVANAVRHSGAKTVRLQFAYRKRSVRLTVTDDGQGFVVDPELRAYGGHWGLLGMRERAAEVGGRLRVRSAPGQGTTVILTAPLRRRGPKVSPRRSDPTSERADDAGSATLAESAPRDQTP